MSERIDELYSMLHFAEHLQQVEKKKLVIPVKPGMWSIREIIGHLYYWDRYMMEFVLPKAEPDAVLTPMPHPAIYNRAAIASLEGRNATRIIENFIAVRTVFIEELQAMDDDIRFTISRTEGEFSRSRMIEMFAAHDLHHEKQMKEFLEGQAK